MTVESLHTQPAIQPNVGRPVGEEPLHRIFLMEDHDEACAVWKSSGIRGRILVHFGGHLDFD